MDVWQYFRMRWPWYAAALALVLMAWSARAYWQTPLQIEPSRLRLSGGAITTTRQHLATILARQAAEHDLEIEVLETQGTGETLELLNDGQLDVGLISGGSFASRHANLQQIATIGVEVVHLLVKPELASEKPFNLANLKGRRINIGRPGSSEFSLANDMLSFIGLKPKDNRGVGDYDEIRLTPPELLAKSQAIRHASAERRQELLAQLPDAIFICSPLPSRTATALLSAAEFHFVPLTFVEPYRLRGSRQLSSDAPLVDRQQVQATVIPAQTYGVTPAFPAEDCTTLGMPLIVVARQGLSRHAVQQLVETLYEGAFAHNLPPADLLSVPTEFPIHPMVSQYLESRKPLAVGDFMELGQKGLSMFGAFSAGVFTFYGYLRRRGGRNPKTYLSEIGAIERLSLELSQHHADPEDKQSRLVQLEHQLTELKQQVVEDYAVGRAISDSTFANLMALISDTRANLSGVVKRPVRAPDLKVLPRTNDVTRAAS